MPKDGYNAVRWLRLRAQEKRGGKARLEDGLSRADGALAVHMDAYLDWMRMKNRTPAAVLSRRGDVLHFLAWVAERGLNRPEEITRAIIESYQRWLHHYRKKNGQALSVSTQYARLLGVQRFFSWLCRERRLENNPAGEIELPRLHQRLPMNVPSPEQVETWLAAPDIGDPLGVRDRAILELFYSTGIRRSELLRLRMDDLNRQNRTLYIRQGKGEKDRVVPVGQRALQWLEKYLDEVRPLLRVNSDEQALFLSAYGAPFHPDVLGRLVIEYLRKADIGYQGGCHLLRHACATHMLEGGADIRYIQQLLGHENLATTAIYTRVSIVQLRAVHEHTHPAERRYRSPE